MRFSALRLASFRGRLNYVNKQYDRSSKKFAKRHEYIASAPSAFNRFGQSEQEGNFVSFANEYTSQESSGQKLNRRPLDRQSNSEEEANQAKSTLEKEPLPYVVTAENRFELLNQILTPLHLLTYDSQLKAKYAALSNLMTRFSYLLRTSKSPVIIDDNGLPCPLHHPVASPKIHEYRNKDEFSIWPGFDGNRKTVGFLLGEPKKHTNAVCVEPDRVIISKKNHRKLASLFQDYLRNHSPYEVNTDLQGPGNWRRFGVRSNELGEHMIYCQMNPQDLTREQLDEEKDRIFNYFDGAIREEFNIKSAFFQPQSGVRTSGADAPYELLFGEETIEETILGKKFRISPESFMQVNISAAEKMYEIILEQLDLTNDTVLIDCCSGIGVIPILASEKVRRVIAIEQSERAHQDAKLNAELNGVKNVHFINSTVEAGLPKLSDEFYGQKVLIVLNPGRGGLHHSVINTIRSFDPVSRVVYVACKPAGVSLKNFVHLAMKSTNKDPGLPLIPIEATPVDLFPSTEHCELVLTFERFL